MYTVWWGLWSADYDGTCPVWVSMAYCTSLGKSSVSTCNSLFGQSHPLSWSKTTHGTNWLELLELVQFDDVRSSGRVWNEFPSDFVALPAATCTPSGLYTVSLVRVRQYLILVLGIM